MDLFTVLQALDEHVTPDRCKLHLAVWNGEFDPLDVYLEGGFDDWQSWQRRKNFGLDLVVALIAMSEPDLWLFAGVHDVVRVEHVEGNHPFRYRMTRRPTCEELDGPLDYQVPTPRPAVLPAREEVGTAARSGRDPPQEAGNRRVSRVPVCLLDETSARPHREAEGRLMEERAGQCRRGLSDHRCTDRQALRRQRHWRRRDLEPMVRILRDGTRRESGSIRVSQRYFGAFRCFSWVI